MTPQREQELRQQAADEIEANDQTIGELLDALNEERRAHEQTINRLAVLQMKEGSRAHVNSLALNEVVKAHADVAHQARQALTNRVPSPAVSEAIASNLMTTLRNVERVLKECK